LDIRARRDSLSSTKKIGFQIGNHVLKRHLRQYFCYGLTEPGNDQVMALAVGTDQISTPMATICLIFSESAYTFQFPGIVEDYLSRNFITVSWYMANRFAARCKLLLLMDVEICLATITGPL
jgi:hypothetical protein